MFLPKEDLEIQSFDCVFLLLMDLKSMLMVLKPHKSLHG